MDYSKKSLLNYYSIEENDIFQTANEFYQFINYLKDEQHNLCDRMPLNGCAPRFTIFDPRNESTKEMIYFGSNDYLNLSRHPKIIQASVDATLKYGTGTGSAPLMGGILKIHHQLIKKTAEFKSMEDAIIHTSGYATNVGSLKAMLREGDLAIIDQYAHASIQDGCTSATVRIFKHSDMNSLENILKLNSKSNYKTKMICVDGVYSMDGDIAPMPEIMEIAKKYGAYVYMDDAHAVGVIGKTGRGTCEHFNLDGKIDIVAGTYSKALGSQGGYVTSSKELIDYLRYYSRAHMFSTVMTPSAAAASLAALFIVLEEPERQKRLTDNINYLKSKLLNLGFNIGNTESAIFPIIIGDDLKVKEFNKYLHQNNIFANTVVYPAVPIELSRLRISIMQGHTIDDFDYLLEHLEKKGKELRII